MAQPHVTPQKAKVRRLPVARKCLHTGKSRWPDKQAAIAVLHQAKASRTRSEESGTKTKRQECRAYKCPFCAGWHTTSKPQLAKSAAA